MSEQVDKSQGAAMSGGKTIGPSGDVASLDHLMDVPLQVTVELGRARMAVSQVLDLTKGSVVELDKAAGDPLEIRVNGRLIARGEAVVVNERFGVRLTEIIPSSSL